jgi:hypothetical protein
MSYAKALSDNLRILHSEERTKHEAKGYWYPSQLGGCDRKNVLQHAGVLQTPPDDRSLRIFWMGNQIHDALQRHTPFSTIGHELDVKDEEYHLSGRVDTLVKTDGVVEVVEFKSLRSDAFQYGLPKPEHILQVGSYLAFPAKLYCDKCDDCQYWHQNGIDKTGTYSESCKEHRCKGKGWEHLSADRARLVYWSKDDARIEEFIIPRTDELTDKVKHELVRLEQLYQAYLKDGSLPDALPETDWRIRGPKVYCDYANSGRCCGDGRTTPVRDTVRVGRKKSSKG